MIIRKSIVVCIKSEIRLCKKVVTKKKPKPPTYFPLKRRYYLLEKVFFVEKLWTELVQSLLNLTMSSGQLLYPGRDTPKVLKCYTSENIVQLLKAISVFQPTKFVRFLLFPVFHQHGQGIQFFSEIIQKKVDHSQCVLSYSTGLDVRNPGPLHHKLTLDRDM